MQEEQFNPQAPGKLPGESPAQDRPGSAATDPATDAEWAEIGRLIERQLRRDVARLVGVAESDDWRAIRSGLLDRARERKESVDHSELRRRVEELGWQAEQRVRGGLADALGAGRYADWSMIARTLRERVENLLDPPGRPYPGGSGTGASVEDASLPAARPSPDLPPVSPEAGGDDTGLPTVTDRVDAPPPHPTVEPPPARPERPAGG